MTPRDRRALVLGGGTILLAVLVLRLVPMAWRSWRADGEALAARRALLERAEAALQGFDAVERRSVETRARFVALAPRLVAGGSEAEAQADLNGRLALIANRERTRLLRADPVPSTIDEGDLRRVAIRLEVETDWAGMVGFLRGVAADPAVLEIGAVSLRGAETPIPGGGPEVLSATVEVSGWYVTRRVPPALEGE